MNNDFMNYDNNPTDEFSGKQPYSDTVWNPAEKAGGQKSEAPQPDEISAKNSPDSGFEADADDFSPEAEVRRNQGENGSYENFGGSGGNNRGNDYNNYRQDWDRYRNGGQPPQMKKKSHKGLFIFLLILIVAVIALGGAYALNKYVLHLYTPEVPLVEGDSLAQINITGTIDESTPSPIDELYNPKSYNHSFIINTIDSLESDSKCKGIVLYFNTPGGSVYATDQVYLKLIEYKQKTGNPVYAIMGPQCCSGGYYIACAADKIFANRNTTTGSIGVTFGTQFDLSGLLEKYGVKTNTITSGANKSMGSMYQPMTDEQRAIYQSIIDEAYAQFTAVVATGRNMTNEQVWPIADGRIYTAAQAKNNGLIDEVCSYDESIVAIQKATGVEDILVYSYKSTTSLKDIILGLAASLKTSSDAENSDLAKAIALAEEASYAEPYYIVNK